eukprot:gene7933-9456_t
MRVQEAADSREMAGSVEEETGDLNERNTDLAAMLQPHVSFPVGSHNIVDAVQSLIDEVIILRRKLLYMQEDSQEADSENKDAVQLPAHISFNEVAIYREDEDQWYIGHISNVNTDGTYHVVCTNGCEIDVEENQMRTIHDLHKIALLPVEGAADKRRTPSLTPNTTNLTVDSAHVDPVPAARPMLPATDVKPAQVSITRHPKNEISDDPFYSRLTITMMPSGDDTIIPFCRFKGDQIQCGDSILIPTDCLRKGDLAFDVTRVKGEYVLHPMAVGAPEVVATSDDTERV